MAGSGQADRTSTYTEADVLRLRGTLKIEYTLAAKGSKRLRDALKALDSREFIAALGTLSGMQAVQMAKAGLQCIYVSGWQVAADQNESLQTLPDLSLYSVNSVPQLVKRINNAFQRADQIWNCPAPSSPVDAAVEAKEAKPPLDYYLPIVGDCEAGFGSPLNVFELVKASIEAGVAAIHLEDQLSSSKRCGHLGSKVLMSTRDAVRNLIAARLAADVMSVDTVIIARTDANSAQFVVSDADPYDAASLTPGGKRTAEGFFPVQSGIHLAIARGLAYAPYADLLWCETSSPSLSEAREFADAIHAHFPGKILCYNLSPSFNWSAHLDPMEIASFQSQLAQLGYKYQFVTLAAFHCVNHSVFELAKAFNERGMPAYVELQDRELDTAKRTTYTCVKHQTESGTQYFDDVLNVVSGGQCETLAMPSSTESQQFAQH